MISGQVSEYSFLKHCCLFFLSDGFSAAAGLFLDDIFSETKNKSEEQRTIVAQGLEQSGRDSGSLARSQGRRVA